MSTRATSFRIGKVQGYLRGSVWYLCYHEHGRRHRPRVGPDLAAAKRLAAQVNGQLAAGAPAALSYEPLAVAELRARWLDHHEHVLRSSVHTAARYRTATAHLLRHLDSPQSFTQPNCRRPTPPSPAPPANRSSTPPVSWRYIP